MSDHGQTYVFSMIRTDRDRPSNPSNPLHLHYSKSDIKTYSFYYEDKPIGPAAHPHMAFIATPRKFVHVEDK